MAKYGDPCTDCDKTEADGAIFRTVWRNDRRKFNRVAKCLECGRARARGTKAASRKGYEPQFEPGDPNAPLKKCSQCGDPKPATTEYFYKDNWSGDGLRTSCKTCISVHGRAYYEDNKERVAVRGRAYREANRERITVTSKVWKSANRDKLLVYYSDYKARKTGASGTFAEEDIVRMRIEQGNCCYYCCVSFDIEPETVDHKQPLSRGGSNWPENLCLACGPCNFSKCNKTEAEFWGYLKLIGQMPEIDEFSRLVRERGAKA